MKPSCIILTLLACLPLFGQKDRGVIPLVDLLDKPIGPTTRAVVIGISDYADEKIPDLRYADKDALAFADYLQSPAGGALPLENIRILVNAQATLGKMYEELEWLVESSMEGDRAIIFFAGHGDIETKTLRKEGFLLCYNSPPHNYRTNAFAIYWLRDVVERLSVQNKAKVVLITDACRAGKLAGNNIGGAQLTTTALQEKFADEIKILSCQPDELSLEGAQWGGGHGAFTYHLINGLYGRADRDNDQQIKLKEVWRYLDDKVPAETAPQPQNPVVIGNMEALLSQVDGAALAFLDSMESTYGKTFSAGDMRGWEEWILSNSDTMIQKAYADFLAALDDGRLMRPENACANTYFNALIAEETISQLHGFLKRRFVAELIDDAQKAINGWLSSDPRETESWSTGRTTDYGEYIPNLERAMEILGKDHYLYKDLVAKNAFFKLRKLVAEKIGPGDYYRGDSATLAQFRQILDEGLRADSLVPYLTMKRSYLAGYEKDEIKSAFYIEKAIQQAPTWIWAYQQLSIQYLILNKPQKALKTLQKALQIDSTYLRTWLGLNSFHCSNYDIVNWKTSARKMVEVMESQPVYRELPFFRGKVYMWSGELEKALKAYEGYVETLNKNQKNGSTSFQKMAREELIQLLIVKERLEDAEKKFAEFGISKEETPFNSWLYFSKMGDSLRAKQYLKMAVANSTPTSIYLDNEVLLFCYDLERLSFQWMEEGIRMHPHDANLHYLLARQYIAFKWDYRKALSLLQRTVELDSNHAMAQYFLASVYAYFGKREKALEHLKLAFKSGFDYPDLLQSDANLEEVRKMAGFRELKMESGGME